MSPVSTFKAASLDAIPNSMNYIKVNVPSEYQNRSAPRAPTVGWSLSFQFHRNRPVRSVWSKYQNRY